MWQPWEGRGGAGGAGGGARVSPPARGAGAPRRRRTGTGGGARSRASGSLGSGRAGTSGTTEFFPQGNGWFLPAKLPPPGPFRTGVRKRPVKMASSAGSRGRRCGGMPEPAECTGEECEGRAAAPGAVQ